MFNLEDAAEMLRHRLEYVYQETISYDICYEALMEAYIEGQMVGFNNGVAECVKQSI